MLNIREIGVALVTPFQADGSVDYAALERLLYYTAENGADFWVVFGTTAETPTLSENEKVEILQFIKSHNRRSLPIVLGMSGNNTAQLVEQIKTTDFNGITAILSAVPSYNKPSQEGIYQHFKAVSEASPIEVILYNVPGRTGANMSAETTIRLARDFRNIAGVKEASGNLSQVQYILRDRPQGFRVWSGEDNLAVAMIALGADGVISVAANVFAESFDSMIHAAAHGDFHEAARLQNSLLEPIDLLFREGNPAGVKCALALRGICRDTLRLPLVGVSERLRDQLRATGLCVELKK